MMRPWTKNRIVNGDKTLDFKTSKKYTTCSTTKLTAGGAPIPACLDYMFC